MDHSSVHDSGDNTPSFFVQFESNSLKKKIIQSGNEHISICTMQFEFSRPQHKQIKKKNISVGNEILSLSSVARQLSELRIAEALKISLKKVWLESTFAPVSSYLHTTKKNWSLLKKLCFGLCIMKNFPQDVSHLPFTPIFAILYYSGSLLVCFYLFHVLVHEQTFIFWVSLYSKEIL